MALSLPFCILLVSHNSRATMHIYNETSFWRVLDRTGDYWTTIPNRERFSESNTEENMKSYLENGFSADKIETELNEENTELYLAQIKNKI